MTQPGIELQSPGPLANTQLIRLMARSNLLSTHVYWKQIPSNKWIWKKDKEDYFRRTRKLVETKRCSNNIIKEVSNWAVLFVRHSELFLKWTREELIQMDKRTGKLLTLNEFLHPRDYIERPVSRKGQGWGLTIIEDNVDALTWGHEDFDLNEHRMTNHFGKRTNWQDEYKQEYNKKQK